MRAAVMTLRLLAFVAVSLSASPAFARDKTDIIYFVNGDRIYCEIKYLTRGKLNVKSVGFSTIDIEWDKITNFESTHAYQFELQSGIRYTGTPGPGDAPGKLAVATAAGGTQLDMARIVEIHAVDRGFWQRVDGSVDIGYEFTQASTATSWNLGAKAIYRTEKWETSLDIDSLLKQQEGADDVNRQTGVVRYMRFLKQRWFTLALASGEKNANQSLLFRGLGSAGMGRRFVQTNRTTVGAYLGLALSRERFQDTDFVSNTELATGFLFDTYRFNTPEVQFRGNFLFLPNLTQSGRYRLQANANVRLELIKDFFWQVSVYESFDSAPPSELANRNDFSLTTSFGWTF